MTIFHVFLTAHHLSWHCYDTPLLSTLALSCCSSQRRVPDLHSNGARSTSNSRFQWEFNILVWCQFLSWWKSLPLLARSKCVGGCLLFHHTIPCASMFRNLNCRFTNRRAVPSLVSEPRQINWYWSRQEDKLLHVRKACIRGSATFAVWIDSKIGQGLQLFMHLHCLFGRARKFAGIVRETGWAKCSVWKNQASVRCFPLSRACLASRLWLHVPIGGKRSSVWMMVALAIQFSLPWEVR